MKIATLDLSPELFIEFLKSSTNGPRPRRFVVDQNPLPADAKVEWLSDVGLNQPVLRLYVSSAEFVDVPDGEPYPALPNVLYRAVFDEAA